MGSAPPLNESLHVDLRWWRRRVDAERMWRVLTVVEQMSDTLVTASSTLKEVLKLVDRHMFALQSRLTSDVNLLRRGLEASSLDKRDQEALLDLLTNLEFSAARIAAFTHRDEHLNPPSDGTPTHLGELLAERQAVDLIAVLAFTHSPDAIIVADEAGIIRLANPATELLTGYHSNELQGANVDILVPDYVRSRHANLRAGYFDDPIIRPMGLGLDLRIRHRDGHESQVDINLSPITLRGGSMAIITIRTIGSSSHGLATE